MANLAHAVGVDISVKMSVAEVPDKDHDLWAAQVFDSVTVVSDSHSPHVPTGIKRNACCFR